MIYKNIINIFGFQLFYIIDKTFENKSDEMFKHIIYICMCMLVVRTLINHLIFDFAQ